MVDYLSYYIDIYALMTQLTWNFVRFKATSLIMTCREIHNNKIC